MTASAKTIIRRERHDRFTIVANRSAEDAKLSFEALGLLTYLLSRPDNWEIRIEQLKGRGGIGKHKIRRIIGELCDAGYMRHERLRDPQSKAFIGVRYVVFDEPQEEKSSNSVLASNEPQSENRPMASEPESDYRAPAEPPAGNQPLYKRITGTKEGSEPKRESAHAQEEKPDRLGLEPVIDDEAEIDATQGQIEKSWPPGAVGNRQKARTLIADLTEAERKAAREAAPRFLRALRDEKRSRTPAIETYLANRDFERFPEPTPQAAEPTIALKPWVVELWVLFWRAFETARKSGEPRDATRLDARILNLRSGLTTPTAAVPSADDIRALVPIKIGEEHHAAWMAYCERHGVDLPRPNVVPVVYVPAGEIPAVSLGWKGYRMAKPARCVIRSREWWWRLYQANDRQIIEAMLREGGRSQGALSVDLGPWPLPTEAAAMVQVHRNTDQWSAWETWFDRKGIYLFWPESSIWCPSEFPPSHLERQKAKEKVA